MNDDKPSAEPPPPHPLPVGIEGIDPAELFARALNSVQPSAGEAEWIPPTPEELARFLPQFCIESLIGHGGMGAVYKGRQPDLDRPVAIKLLPTEVAADERFVARFRREARTLAKLQHPGIVTVFNSGQTSEGHLYFVMEFVEGTDLHRILHGPGLTPAQALELMSQVCDALHYAHGKDVIHRDIKPGNILVTSDGRAKLADFGLARPLYEESGTLTGANVMMGTADYMAPEQRGGHADRRADIYALGVMLYEMLVGKRPRGAFDPPSHKVQVDIRLDEVVMKALQQQPERRYQQVSEMKIDMDRIRTTRQSVVPEPLEKQVSPVVGSGRKPQASHRYPFGVKSAVILGLIAVAGVFIWKTRTISSATAATLTFEAAQPLTSGGVAINLGNHAAPRLVDWNNDGVLDLLVAAGDGYIWLFRRSQPTNGTNFDSGLRVTASGAPIRVGTGYSGACFADINGDGKRDLIAAGNDNRVRYYSNTGKAAGPDFGNFIVVPGTSEQFVLPDSVGGRIDIADWDGDGKLDLLTGEFDGYLTWYRNTGTPNAPIFGARGIRLKRKGSAIHEAYNVHPRVFDFNQDGVPDLAFGINWGRVKLLINKRGSGATDFPTDYLLRDTNGAELNIRALNSDDTIPDFADLTGDGVLDVISGGLNGKLFIMPGASHAPTFQRIEEIREEARVALSQTGVILPDDCVIYHPQWGIILNMHGTQIRDPLVLRSLPIDGLQISSTRVEDISALRGTAIRMLSCDHTGIHDLSPLLEMPRLESAMIPQLASNIEVLRHHPTLRYLGWEGGNWDDQAKRSRLTVAEFWQRYDAQPDAVKWRATLSNAGWRQFELKVLSDATYEVRAANRGITDLSPLAGAPISALYVTANPISSLEPLRDMPLRKLWVNASDVNDLEPLRGMFLETLCIHKTKVTDLGPLVGTPLRGLFADDNPQLKDLTPLAQIGTLEDVLLPSADVDPAPLRNLPNLKFLGDRYGNGGDGTGSGKPTSEFWAEYDARAVQRAREAEIRNAARAALAGSGSVLPEGGVVDTSQWGLSLSLRNTRLRDPTLLGALPIDRLVISETEVEDISSLRGLQVRAFSCELTGIHDLSPLLEMPRLEAAMIPQSASNIGVLRHHPTLKYLGWEDDFDNDARRPRLTVAEFWQRYDAQPEAMQLRFKLSIAGWAGFQLEVLSDGTYKLSAEGRGISDLSPLASAPISILRINYNPIISLEALRGMPLRDLEIHDTKVSDLEPIRNLPLEVINVARNQVSDLSPLVRSPLRRFIADNSPQIKDLSPLAGISTLEEVILPSADVDPAPLRGLPNLKYLSDRVDGDRRATKFWAEYDKRTAKAARESEVRKGARAALAGTGASLPDDRVKFSSQWGLVLNMQGTPLSDLAPIKSLPIEGLMINRTKVENLAVLRGTAFRMLSCDKTPVQDLSPLLEMPQLEAATIPQSASNIEVLRAHPTLKHLGWEGDWDNKLGRPRFTAAEFWQRYDTESEAMKWRARFSRAGWKGFALTVEKNATYELRATNCGITDLAPLADAPISALYLAENPITSLAPLRGAPLRRLCVDGAGIRDLEPLRGKPLDSLCIHNSKVTDLTPLTDMPLRSFVADGNPQLTDLTPLSHVGTLEDIVLPSASVDPTPLRALPNLKFLREQTGTDNRKPASEFWAEYDARQKETIK